MAYSYQHQIPWWFFGSHKVLPEIHPDLRFHCNPLTALLRKNAFHWLPAVTGAFLPLKEAVTSPPVLRLPDFTKQFTIECDACGTGLGAVLMQEGRPIAFFSQALKGRALLLSTCKKELLSLVSAIQKWRPYLLGQPFTVKTDQ